MKRVRNVSVLEEYIIGEANGEKLLLSHDQFQVATERFELLSPQLPKDALSDTDRLMIKYQAEMAISRELRSECERLSLLTEELGVIRGKMHTENLALREIASRKWWQVLLGRGDSWKLSKSAS